MGKPLHQKMQHFTFLGGHLLHTNDHHILFGAKTGIHQDFLACSELAEMESKLADIVILGDISFRGNISCYDLEFLFLTSMFLGMDFPNGKTTSRLFDFATKKVIRKFKVVVKPGEASIVWDQLEPSLLGASKQFLKNQCKLNKNLWQMLTSEASFFNLKNEDGDEYSIEELVEVIEWDQKTSLEIGNVIVCKGSELDTFSVIDNEHTEVETLVDINFGENEIAPVWDIPVGQKHINFREGFVIPLGTSSPFATDAPPTSYWFNPGNGNQYLIDCGFYTDMVLEKNGGDIEKIKGVFLSHCHGDHFNPIPFMYRSKPIELWTTKENFKLAEKISCAKAKITASEFRKKFKFKEVEASYPGFESPRYSFGENEIQFHYSIHPIPTIGLTLFNGAEKDLVFSSDMVDFDFMQDTLLPAGVINQERIEIFKERFYGGANKHTIFLLDCGGDGFIHGRPDGYKKYFENPENVIECHKGKRESEDDKFMPLAKPIIAHGGRELEPEEFIISHLGQFLFDNGVKYVIDFVAQLSKLSSLKEFRPGETILNKDVKSHFFQIIIYGKAKTSSGVVLKEGDWFNEEKLIGEDLKHQTITAISPCRVIRLNSNKFLNLIDHYEVIKKELIKGLKNTFVSKNKTEMVYKNEQVPILNFLPGEEFSLEKISSDKELFVLEGALRVERDNKLVKVFNRSTWFDLKKNLKPGTKLKSVGRLKLIAV